MDKLKVFHILGLEETKDKELIKQAYRIKLQSTNPEDDEEGFKLLREAFETAIELSDASFEDEEKEVDQSPVGIWIRKIEDCYASLSQRINREVWEELLSDEVCTDLDTTLEARNKLIEFLMYHIRLPQEIFNLIDETFYILEEIEELKEHIPEGFLSYFKSVTKNEHFMELYLFKGDDKANYDAFILEYFDLKDKIDRKEFEEAEKVLNQIAHYHIYHPFLEIEKLKYHLGTQTPYDKESVKELEENYQDITYIKYHLIYLKWEEEQYEEMFQDLTDFLEKYPEYYLARCLQAKYYAHVGKYAEAKEECENLLNITSDPEINDLLVQANNYFIADLEEKKQEDLLSLEDTLELGWCYYENERAEECVELLCEIEPDEKHYLDFHNLYGRALAYAHKYEEALPVLAIWEEEIVKLVDDGTDKKFKKKKRRFILARFLQALCWQDLSKTREDSEYCKEKALEFLTFDIDAWDDFSVRLSCYGLKAQLLLDLKRMEESIEICKYLLELDHGYFPALVIMQEAYYYMREFQMVIDIFHQAIEIYEDYVKPYIFAAKVFYLVQQYDNALDIIKQARDKDLEEPELDYLELKILRFTAVSYNQTREMIPLCDELLETLETDEFPDTEIVKEDVHFEKIYAYMDINEFSTALSLVNECIKTYTDTEFYRIKAKILAAMEHYKEALSLFLKYQDDDRYDSSYQYGMGTCYEHLNAEEKAIEQYEKTLEINSGHYMANHSLSSIYMQRIRMKWNRKEYELAVEYAEKQLIVSETGYYYIECALVYMEGYEFENALKYLFKVTELEPENLYAYNNIGWIYMLTKRHDEAEEMFQKAIELDTDNQTTLPYRNLMDLYVMMHKSEKAIQVAELVRRNYPDLFWFRVMGDLYKGIGRYSKAISFYSKGIKADPKREVELLELIAISQQAKKSYSLAKDYHLRYLERTDLKVRGNYNLGEFYLFCKGDLEKAYEYYEKALLIAESRPASYDFHYVRSMVCMVEISCRMNKPKKAKEYYQKAIDYIQLNYGDIEQYCDWPSFRIMYWFQIFLLHYFAGYFEQAEAYLKNLFCDTRCTNCKCSICAEAMTAKAYCHMAKEEWKEAYQCFMLVNAEDPSEIRVRYEIKLLKKKKRGLR